VNFTLKDIDRLSRKTPVVCKVAPSPNAPGKFYHLEDVNRAGGIMAIMGILSRAGLLDPSAGRVDGSLAQALERYDVASPSLCDSGRGLYTAAAGRTGLNLVLGSQSATNELDLNRASGCIRDIEHCYFRDGGLAVLHGNIAEKGCIVKSAGVDPSILTFSGTARVFDSQEQAADGILAGKVNAGDIVVIRYEGPKGGPGMQEMLYPTSYIKSMHLDKQCALLTDGRFSGGTSGLSIGHVSPEAAAGGAIGLVKSGDTIDISIPKRTINVALTRQELSKRRAAEKRKGAKAFKPVRKRVISDSLKAYALFTTSADVGAVRMLPNEASLAR
jgi:dihydroxy-acid dehydratase